MPMPTAPAPAAATGSLDPMAAMNAGIAAADGPENAKERADVDAWLRRINRTQAYDAPARRNYVKCRRYARGDSGFVVDANIVGTNIDILEAFIYAKNPDVAITPAKAVEMPSQEAMLEAAMFTAEQDPRVQQAVEEVTLQAALVPPMDTVDEKGQIVPAVPPEQQVEMARAAAIQGIAAENYAKIKSEYQRRTRENKAFAETLELVVSSMWKRGRLKDRGRPWVRSALTTGLGVLKASWQQRTAPSPETVTAINDLQQQLARVKYLRQQIAENQGSTEEQDVQLADLGRQLQALQSQNEPVVSRGFVIDLTTPENFVVAPGFRIADHMDAPWNAERIPMEFEEACSAFKLTEAQRGKVTKYMARMPMTQRPESANAEDLEGVDPLLAEAFVRGDADGGGDPNNVADGMNVTNGAGCFVMVWEIWDRTSNSVMTTIEGLQTWVKPAWNPCPTTRFYPFFLFCTSEVDGQRHPQSPVERSAKLVDEYNRIGSAEAKHRRRIIPKTGFNAGAFNVGEAEKLEKADIQEMVALKLTNPGADLRTILFPITYAAIDPALYDRARINNEIERIWGVQEALGGGITVDKTATEAEIQQEGFNARTGSRRGSIEDTLAHMALYTAEVGRKYQTAEDVRAIAGPNAFWPSYEGAPDLARFVDVDITAGTTGKPNTKSQREAWGQVMPMLQTAITTYAQLVQSNPKDLAESIKKLATITAQRAGERIDIDSLFPPPGQAPIDPITGQPIVPGQPTTSADGKTQKTSGDKPGGNGGQPSPAAAPEIGAEAPNPAGMPPA